GGDVVRAVRGRGLWLALVLGDGEPAGVETAAREAGFIVNAIAPDAVRLAPPLVLTNDEAMSFVDALPGILRNAPNTGAEITASVTGNSSEGQPR
ncbi:MAG TPA: hypothetical protein VKJ07_02470, partial [Mycobacteriales bacterium]|nr:hypothetical protein [Mycobacteriales bacterium]